MSTRTVAVPRVLCIRADATDGLADLLGTDFDLGDVVVACGQEQSRALAQSFIDALDSGGYRSRVHDNLDGTLHGAAQLLEALDDRPATTVVAFGGGRPIDVAKLAASRAGIPFVAVPTVLSHDGLCSPVVSLLASDGRRRSLAAATPAGVVVDTTIVGRAPLRFLRAGLGDLVSNISAVHDWNLASREHGEPVDELAASMAMMSARSVLDIGWPPTDADIALLARGLVMSGLAMEIAGSSRPCSGGEHLISHALDRLLPDGDVLHGEQVALGTLLTCRALDAPETTRIIDLLGRAGFADSSSWPIDRDTLVKAVEMAPTTRPDRRTVLDHVLAVAGGAEQLVDRALR